jgi:Protein of Unknown function (DUF2784)
MLFRFAADSTLLLHLLFIVFALLGGIMALWQRWIPLVHIPAAIWALTYLENYFRVKAGQSGYAESFIEHYLLNIIYPAGLTHNMQFALAGVVAVVNITIYGWLIWRRHGGSLNDR